MSSTQYAIDVLNHIDWRTDQDRLEAGLALVRKRAERWKAVAEAEPGDEVLANRAAAEWAFYEDYRHATA